MRKVFGQRAMLMMLALLLVAGIGFPSFAADTFNGKYEVLVSSPVQVLGQDVDFDNAMVIIKDKEGSIDDALKLKMSEMAKTEKPGGIVKLTGSGAVTLNGSTENISVVVQTNKKVVKNGMFEVRAELDSTTDDFIEITAVYNTKNPDPTAEDNKALKDFLDGFSTKIEKGNIILTIPEPPTGYLTYFIIKDAKGNLVVDYSDDDFGGPTQVKELGKVSADAEFVVAAQLDNPTTHARTEEDSRRFTFKSDKAPVLNYAYIIDGGLILNATSESGMAEIPIYWKYSDESAFHAIASDHGFGHFYSDKSKDTKDFSSLFGTVEFNKYKRLDENDYRIPVTIPCKVQIVLIDNLGHKTPVVLDINKDNTGLFGSVPAYVNDLFKKVDSSEGISTKKEDKLLIINKNTTVNLFNEFKDGITKEFKNFNSRELVFSCEEMTSFDPFDIKFDKAGRFEFSVTHTNLNGEFKFTVLVMDGGNNIKSFKIKKEVRVPGTSFKPETAFEFVTNNKKDPNPVGFYAEYDGKYYRLNDEIPFGDKDKIIVKFKDILNNKMYECTFIKGALEKVNIDTARSMFSDVKGHWAHEYIAQMVSNGVIAGYPDGTFKPNNMISKREVLAIVGRYASIQKDGALVPEVHKEVKYQASHWGNEEVEYALKRLPVNIFESDVALDEAATREQVAYILAHNFKFQGAETSKDLTDIETSAYPAEIKKLIGSGTIDGYPDKTFKPALQITRAELVKLISSVPNASHTFRFNSNVVNPSSTVTTDNLSTLFD